MKNITLYIAFCQLDEHVIPCLPCGGISAPLPVICTLRLSTATGGDVASVPHGMGGRE